jgi:hypothetical protein
MDSERVPDGRVMYSRWIQIRRRTATGLRLSDIGSGTFSSLWPASISMGTWRPGGTPPRRHRRRCFPCGNTPQSVNRHDNLFTSFVTFWRPLCATDRQDSLSFADLRSRCFSAAAHNGQKRGRLPGVQVVASTGVAEARRGRLMAATRKAGGEMLELPQVHQEHKEGALWPSCRTSLLAFPTACPAHRPRGVVPRALARRNHTHRRLFRAYLTGTKDGATLTRIVRHLARDDVEGQRNTSIAN